MESKWQKRVVQTLAEAHHPLTIRQLRIRCGMRQDKYGTLMRMTLARLTDNGVILRVSRGLYTLKGLPS